MSLVKSKRKSIIGGPAPDVSSGANGAEHSVDSRGRAKSTSEKIDKLTDEATSLLANYGLDDETIIPESFFDADIPLTPKGTKKRKETSMPSCSCLFHCYELCTKRSIDTIFGWLLRES